MGTCVPRVERPREDGVKGWVRRLEGGFGGSAGRSTRKGDAGKRRFETPTLPSAAAVAPRGHRSATLGPKLSCDLPHVELDPRVVSLKLRK
jgi:hypothetical protein